MTKQIAIVYTINEPSSWRSENGIDIKSNIAGDDTVSCEIAKSLVAELKENSALLEPDKLLLSFAEAQKRGIEDNLESLNDFELTAKNHADSIHAKLLVLEEDSEKKYNELLEKFSKITANFDSKIIKTTEKLTAQFALIKDFEDKIKTINTYSLDNISESINKILLLLEKDPELIKLVFENKFNSKDS